MSWLLAERDDGSLYRLHVSIPLLTERDMETVSKNAECSHVYLCP